MASKSQKPREKLIDAALELFFSQGITNTATRQIANLADVNEATLFRNFGNKYGLLQAVIQEAEIFEAIEHQVKSHLQTEGADDYPSLKQYALAFLEAIAAQESFLCSLIGEAENYSPEFKQALAQALTQSNQRLHQLIHDSIPNLSDGLFSGLFHGLLLSYAVFRVTNQVPEPWANPENYVDAMLRLLVHREPESDPIAKANSVQDLSRPLVHALLQQAKKQGLRDFAVMYLLLGAGLSPTELCGLQKRDRMADGQQHILTVRHEGRSRQVPINQWILGKRYGSNTNNPLTKWLKSRKDDAAFIFVTEAGLGMAPTDIERLWMSICEALGQSIQIWQCAQTWQVEMLMRGITVENLSILAGVTVKQLQPLVDRAREKAALEQAMALDKKVP